jgi:hypothetical protein
VLLIRAARATFGGFKQSGVDCDKAPPVFAAYTERHTNQISFGDLRVLFRQPASWRP